MNSKETIVCYFTGTGNSLVFARMLGASFGNCDIVSMVSQLRKENTRLHAGRIILCFPLYFLGMPKPVMDFLDRTEFDEGAAVYAVVTRGFAPMGGVRAQLKSYAKKRKFRAGGCFYVDFPNNDVTLFDIYSKEKNDKLLASVPAAHERVVRLINASRAHFDFEPFAFMLYFRHRGAYLDRLKDFGKEFHADDRCNGCGLCAKVCPADNITMVAGRPQWSDGCVLCEACLNWCPTQALQFGRATSQKGRYHHDAVKVTDMTTQKS